VATHSVYKFFDPEQDSRAETNHLFTQGIPLDLAMKLNKINNHNKDLCMLGILPNQLRSLLKLYNQSEYDTAFEDISRELFWQGYTIWKARKQRMKHFWKNIAPDWWKRHQKEVKDFKKLNERKIAEECSSPFHFLRRIKNLSGLKPNRCTCSHVQYISSMHKFRD